MNKQKLKTALAEYMDIDGVLHYVAIALGILPEDTGFTEAKGIYWTNNPLCNFLGETVLGLTELGILVEELDEDGERNQRYKWNPDYVDPVTKHRKEG